MGGFPKVIVWRARLQLFNNLLHFWLVGAAGFEPATTRTPSEKEEES
jgi:hypothetical protein